jgi:uncharacterized protein YoxC
MASQQVLSLIVSAIDKASSVLGRVSGAVKGLGGSADQATSKQDNLSNAIAFGMMKAQVAINGVQMAYGKLTAAMQEASQIELENLSTASGLEEMLGSFDKAAKFVDDINSSLAKSAAALPGATKDYTALARTISDDVAAAFKGADGKINDVSGFKKSLESISTSYAAMAATNNIAAGNMQLFMMKALGGTASQAELMQIDALQKNPQLRTRLEEAMKQAGVKSLKDLSVEKRIKLLEEVGRKVITPEFLKRSQDTVEGMWQSFVSGLFDPMGGIFGVMRDLEPQLDGQQTVFESAKKTLAMLIGSDGLLAQVSAILESLGLTVDPMRVLKDGIDRLNGFLSAVNKFLGSIKTGIGEGYTDFGELVQSKLRMIFADVASALNDRGFDTSSIDGFITSTIGKINLAIERGLSWLYTNGLPMLQQMMQQGQQNAQNLLNNLNWGEIGVAFGGMVGRLIGGLIRTVASLDFSGSERSILSVFMAAIQFIFGAIGGAVLGVFEGIAPGATQAAGDMVRDVGRMIVDFIKSIPGKIGGAIANGSIIQGAVNLSPLSGVSNAVQAVAQTPIGQAITQSPPVQAAGDLLSKFTGGLFNNIAPKFNGHIPNAAGGLIGAAQRESAAMPSGAQVVVANSQEFILKPTGRSANSGGGGNVFNFYINGDNARSIADQVVAIIQQKFDDELSAQLA